MIKYTDKTLMPFGKYKGTALGNVPASYLLWLRENATLSEPMKQYLEDNLAALQKEVRHSRRFNAR